jgi:hypothetical protein
MPFLPAWYLPKGRINATENQLDKASSSCEWWAIGFGLLVIFSVIVEVIVALAAPSYSDFLFDSVFTDAGIAIGVVGEVAFGMWDSRIQTELRKRSNDKLGAAEKAAAEANVRAAEAEKGAVEARLQIFKLQMPRQLDEQKFLKELEAKPKATVNVIFDMDTSDGSILAAQLLNLLTAAGWVDTKLSFLPKPARFDNALPATFSVHANARGITVVGQSLNGAAPPPDTAFMALWRAIAEGGASIFAPAVSADPTLPDGRLRVVIAARH